MFHGLLTNFLNSSYLRYKTIKQCYYIDHIDHINYLCGNKTCLHVKSPYLYMKYNYLYGLCSWLFQMHVMGKISPVVIFSSTESTLMLLDYLSGRPLWANSGMILEVPTMMELLVTTHTQLYLQHEFVCVYWASPKKHSFYHMECIWKRDQQHDAFWSESLEYLSLQRTCYKLCTHNWSCPDASFSCDFSISECCETLLQRLHFLMPGKTLANTFPPYSAHILYKGLSPKTLVSPHAHDGLWGVNGSSELDLLSVEKLQKMMYQPIPFLDIRNPCPPHLYRCWDHLPPDCSLEQM